MMAARWITSRTRSAALLRTSRSWSHRCKLDGDGHATSLTLRRQRIITASPALFWEKVLDDERPGASGGEHRRQHDQAVDGHGGRSKRSDPAANGEALAQDPPGFRCHGRAGYQRRADEGRRGVAAKAPPSIGPPFPFGEGPPGPPWHHGTDREGATRYSTARHWRSRFWLRRELASGGGGRPCLRPIVVDGSAAGPMCLSR